MSRCRSATGSPDQSLLVDCPVAEVVSASATRQPRATTVLICLLFMAPPLAKSAAVRSEEHTSELQSRFDLVCRLLLEKKKTNTLNQIYDAAVPRIVLPRLTLATATPHWLVNPHLL